MGDCSAGGEATAARTILTDYGANKAAADAGILSEIRAFEADHRPGRNGAAMEGADIDQGYR